MSRILVFLLLPTLSLATTRWILDTESASCSGAFSLDYFSVECAEDGACTPGEEATIGGQSMYHID
jgi:hypothetical protein